MYYDSSIIHLPNGLVRGAYFDDRVGLSILVNIAEQLHKTHSNKDIYLVASNHEEIGMRGAIVAANTIKPNYCIAIDVTHATDYPTMNPIANGDIQLNKGCVLTKSPNIDEELFVQLRQCAVNNQISYQIEATPYPTGTDANPIQIINEGVRTAVISIPCRYMHTPQEIVAEGDIQTAVKLLSFFFTN